ncbi:hypothetical protein CI105_05510 [Candidatus Izimaplasma bacterium ZiA1]|uniref:glycoside hydrolase family 38 N-terminal domain-containing protein n=1 Tax=Candidatus Izimoplasma sp. ZiA1 TaxID=2024899 RepID=UPI000BAA4A4E|nr:hypothetical protein CI105_05510 [Candidatus Izimaplasma bacterium ZiA1]
MKIYLMHQTHTDIGYTDRQEKITKYHIDYLKQAIVISEKIANGEKDIWKSFVWNNESFWIIDTFLKHESEEWVNRLKLAIQRKHIEVTGNYLNLTELVDYDALKTKMKKVEDFALFTGVKINSAISMDINGWGWGYSDLLYESGVTRFFTSIHNHHGFVPFLKKQTAFYWETPNKNKVLVWNGDVYNQGNVSKLVPNVVADFTKGLFNTKAIIDDERLTYAKKWFDDYIKSLEKEDYSYDFLPILTKGLLVDNAPPNPHIMEAITRFNELFGEQINIELIGINEFFDKLEKMDLDLKTYSGDWTDWWSDGFMSTPRAVSLYKEAQRNYKKILSLKNNGFNFDQELLTSLEENMIMFAEHTWGYFTSVSEPWNKMTVKLESRNCMFAELANKYADQLLDDYKEKTGEMMKSAGRPMRYKIKNPYNYELKKLVKIYINWWEDFIVDEGYKLYDLESNQELDYQEILVDQKSRKEVRTYITLAPYEEKVLEIRKHKTTKREMSIDPLFTRDERYDFKSPYLNNEIYASQFKIESPYFLIEFEKDLGITKLLDKTTNESLLRCDSENSLFTPVYEVSEVQYDYLFAPQAMSEIRKDIGRNRKLFSSIIQSGKLVNSKVIANGPIFSRVQLKYLLKGTIYSVVEITLYKEEPIIDFSYILGKDTVWEPESMYLSIPLTVGEKEELWINKNGTNIRPRIDQLPQTLTKFYTMNNGYSLVTKNKSLNLVSMDAPLLYMGSLKPGEIKLHGDKTLNNTDDQYIWLMNNYWETNFSTSLGGFYQFDFSMNINYKTNNESEAMEELKKLSSTFLVYQVKDYDKV